MVLTPALTAVPSIIGGSVRRKQRHRPHCSLWFGPSAIAQSPLQLRQIGTDKTTGDTVGVGPSGFEHNGNVLQYLDRDCGNIPAGLSLVMSEPAHTRKERSCLRKGRFTTVKDSLLKRGLKCAKQWPLRSSPLAS